MTNTEANPHISMSTLAGPSINSCLRWSIFSFMRACCSSGAGGLPGRGDAPSGRRFQCHFVRWVCLLFLQYCCSATFSDTGGVLSGGVYNSPSLVVFGMKKIFLQKGQGDTRLRTHHAAVAKHSAVQDEALVENNRKESDSRIEQEEKEAVQSKVQAETEQNKMKRGDTTTIVHDRYGFSVTEYVEQLMQDSAATATGTGVRRLDLKAQDCSTKVDGTTLVPLANVFTKKIASGDLTLVGGQLPAGTTTKNTAEPNIWTPEPEMFDDMIDKCSAICSGEPATGAEACGGFYVEKSTRICTFLKPFNPQGCTASDARRTFRRMPGTLVASQDVDPTLVGSDR
ncbi:unnamed protein product [Amoebophrya sp. A120]|nr:unnamed protein product [Amoebophrya sp. A120]|eukprot:GSA120T00006628001.1